jgi:hypothetical protein
MAIPKPVDTRIFRSLFILWNKLITAGRTITCKKPEEHAS